MDCADEVEGTGDEVVTLSLRDSEADELVLDVIDKVSVVELVSRSEDDIAFEFEGGLDVDET